jgi:lysophospholipase L1-like esterase
MITQKHVLSFGYLHHIANAATSALRIKDIKGLDAVPGASTPAVVVTSILFRGDSTAAGVGAPIGQSEADDLQQILGVPVIKAGVAGADTQDDLQGIGPYFSSPLATRLASDPSQIVIMNYGLNDSLKVTVDVYKQNLTDWVSTVRSYGKIAVFEEPNPSSIDTYEQVMPNFVSAMDSVAAQLNVPLVKQYNYIQTLPNWQSMLVDGLHPNAQLYAIKAARTAAVVRPLM